MASSSRPHHRYTYAQYAALERESSTKHEFFDGEIYAMAGGTEDHAALAVSTLAALPGTQRRPGGGQLRARAARLLPRSS